MGQFSSRVDVHSLRRSLGSKGGVEKVGPVSWGRTSLKAYLWEPWHKDGASSHVTS